MITCLAFYLIGSIPAAYLLVKRKYHKDLTEEGSKNVGTLNALKVSGSKRTAGLVLLVDFLKGTIPVYYLIFVSGQNVTTVFVSGIFLVIGHNYSVWLGFKGGRGLATAAGIFSVVNFITVLSWGIIWLIYFFLIKKDVLAANLTATFLFPFLALAFKGIYMDFLHPSIASNEYYIFLIFNFVVSFLIIIRHSEIFRKLRSRVAA